MLCRHAWCYFVLSLCTACRYFTPEEAVQYGIIDKVMQPSDAVVVSDADLELTGCCPAACPASLLLLCLLLAAHTGCTSTVLSKSALANHRGSFKLLPARCVHAGGAKPAATPPSAGMLRTSSGFECVGRGASLWLQIERRDYEGQLRASQAQNRPRSSGGALAGADM